MIYKSCISTANKIIFGFVFFILILATIPIFYCNDLTSFIVVVSINLAALFFLAWILFDTEYSIDKTHLYCKSGPFQKKIAIATIQKISHHKGVLVPVMLKLALIGFSIISPAEPTMLFFGFAINPLIPANCFI